MAANVMEIYGSKVFNEHVMKERLPSATYKSLKNTLHKGSPLDIEVANVVAPMRCWTWCSPKNRCSASPAASSSTR